jgi:hypothetical protein
MLFFFEGTVAQKVGQRVESKVTCDRYNIENKPKYETDSIHSRLWRWRQYTISKRT